MKVVVLALATTVAFASAAWAQNTQSGGDAAGNKGTATESQSGKAMSKSSSGTQIGVENKSGDSARTSIRTRSRVSVKGESGPDVMIHKRPRRHVIVAEDQSPSVTVMKKKKKYVSRNRMHIVASGPESSTTIVRNRRSTSRTVVDGGRNSASVRLRSKAGTNSSTTARGTETRSTTGSGSSETTGSGSTSTTGSSTNAPPANGSTSSGSGTSTGTSSEQKKN